MEDADEGDVLISEDDADDEDEGADVLDLVLDEETDEEEVLVLEERETDETDVDAVVDSNVGR